MLICRNAEGVQLGQRKVGNSCSSQKLNVLSIFSCCRLNRWHSIHVQEVHQRAQGRRTLGQYRRALPLVSAAVRRVIGSFVFSHRFGSLLLFVMMENARSFDCFVVEATLIFYAQLFVYCVTTRLTPMGLRSRSA